MLTGTIKRSDVLKSLHTRHPDTLKFKLMEGDQIHPGYTGISNETTGEKAYLQVIPEAIDLSKPYDLFYDGTEEEAQEDFESFRAQWLNKNEQKKLRMMSHSSKFGIQLDNRCAYHQVFIQ